MEELCETMVDEIPDVLSGARVLVVEIGWLR